MEKKFNGYDVVLKSVITGELFRTQYRNFTSETTMLQYLKTFKGYEVIRVTPAKIPFFDYSIVDAMR